MIPPHVADQVVALVRDRLPLLDPDDLDELHDAILKIGGEPREELKACTSCSWRRVTTSTHCGECGHLLRTATS